MKLKRIVMWALTYKCNMKCKYCYLKNVKCLHSDLSKEECLKIADLICNDEKWKPDAIWLTGGEPTIKEFLPQLISKFEQANIRVVIDTNGMCTNDMLLQILETKPKGIIVSLDSHLEDELSERGDNRTIKDRIEFIAKHKDSLTILGTAVVLTKVSIDNLFKYAEEMSNRGVEYISLNPYHSVDGCEEKISGDYFRNVINEIKKSGKVKIPSDDYLNMVVELYDHTDGIKIQCPAFYDFYFISPWGYIYPCSNENWQGNGKIYNFNALDCDGIYNKIEQIRDELSFSPKSNKAHCFGKRCIGCWKLYYDTIFTV